MRRRALLFVLAAVLGGCGRRGKLRLPEREDGKGSEPQPAAPSQSRQPERRSPAPAGLLFG